MGQRKPLNWGGGVNLYADPRALGPDQLALGKNTFPTLEGLLHKRESVRPIGRTRAVTSGGAELPIQPIDFFVPDPISGYDFIIHAHFGPGTVSGEFLAGVRMDELNTGVGAGLAPNFISLGAASPYTPVPASYVNYRGRTLVMAANAEGFYQWQRDGAGNWGWIKVTFAWPSTAAGVAKAQSQVVPVQPQVAASHYGRMVYGNFGPGMGHWIVFADLNSTTHTNVTDNPLWALVGSDVLASNGNHLELDEIAGEDICAIHDIALANITNPLQRALLVLTRQGSAVICTGEPVQTSDAQFADANGYLGNFNAAKVNYKCGGTGPNAVKSTPYGTFWVANNDVWMIPNQMPQPIRVGTNIRPALLAVPPALRPYISMAYADATLYVSLPTAASTSERNMAVEHWRLDLYDGPPQGAQPAKWWGPQDYTTMSAWLSAGQVLANQAEAVLSPCLVTRPNADRETVVGMALAVDSNGTPRTFFVSFNEDNRPLDVPFESPTTGRVWSAQDNADGVTVPVGDIVRPTTLLANGRLYVVTIAGIPAAAEPVWPTASGGTVVSGGATYAEIRTTSQWNRLINFYAANAQHAIAMDVQFRADDWGNPSRHKILRRIDINAYFSTRAWSVFRAILDQGNRVGQLGPVALGDFTLISRLVPAMNDLGILELDVSAVANEFQSKSYKPRLASGVLRSPPGGTPTVIADFGVLRARHIQPNFCDLPGLIIDDTNNYISWCSFQNGAILQVFTAQLTSGYYANVDTLLAHIISVMNTAQGAAISGFTINANPWSYDSAFAGAYPYMTTLTFAFTGRTGGKAVALLFGSGLVIQDLSVEATTLLGVTCYPGRTKVLLTMLGYDTTAMYTAANAIVDTFADVRAAQLTGEQMSPVLASPTRLCGVEVVPYQRPAAIQIGALEIEAAVLPGLPLTAKNR